MIKDWAYVAQRLKNHPLNLYELTDVNEVHDKHFKEKLAYNLGAINSFMQYGVIEQNGSTILFKHSFTSVQWTNLLAKVQALKNAIFMAERMPKIENQTELWTRKE